MTAVTPEVPRHVMDHQVAPWRRHVTVRLSLTALCPKQTGEVRRHYDVFTVIIVTCFA